VLIGVAGLSGLPAALAICAALLVTAATILFRSRS
jgi:hypothetical protein